MLGIYRAAALLALCSAFAGQPAWSKDHGHGNGHGHEDRDYGDDRDDRDDHDGQGHRYEHEEHRGGERVVMIEPHDRVEIRRYYEKQCPPGLAKKRNGCLPPGHVRHYHRGQALPQYVEYRPVPRDLLVQLQPVPVGYRYVAVDQDVLLISEASHEIIDAITLLSAVR